MVFLGKNEGFVLRYSSGKHIKTQMFSVPTKRQGTFQVTVSGLFLPLQLHNQLEGKQPQTHIIPVGGDIFSLFINGSLLNFFVMDLVGHGFHCHKLAEFLIRKAIEKRKRSDVVQWIGNYWLKKRNNIKNAVLKRMRKAAKVAIQKGYDSAQIIQLTKAKDALYNVGMVTAAQALVNLDTNKINFDNFGHPEQFFVLLQGNSCEIYTMGQSITGKHLPLGFLELSNLEHGTIDINPRADDFKIIMFSDAVLEQSLICDEEDSTSILREYDTFLKKHITDRVLLARHEEFLREKQSFMDAEDTLLKDTIKHLSTKDPETIVRFFYEYLIRLNPHGQEDDMTFVVVDFKKQLK